MQVDPKYTDAIILLARVKAEFSLQEAIDFIASLDHLEDLEASVRIFLSVLLWQNGQKTESLLLFKKEYLIDVNSAKTLFLHFPEAQEIPEFLQILDLKNE